MTSFDPQFYDVVAGAQGLPSRLQVLLDALIALTPRGETPKAELSELRVEIGRREGSPIMAPALRQRLSRLNVHLGNGVFQLVTRAGAVVAVPTPRWESGLRSSEVAKALRERSQEALRFNVASMVAPRARPEKLTIMFSYAWLEDEQQQIQLDFYSKLVAELARRPEQYAHLPKIEFWRDEKSLDLTMQGDPQMDAACEDAFLGLIMMSTKYPTSDPCLREAAYFITEDGANQPNKRTLLINVNCALDEIPARFKAQNRIAVTGEKGKHLLRFWDGAGASDRHDFVRRIVLAICRAADEWLKDFPSPTSPDGAGPDAPRKVPPEFANGGLFRLEHEERFSVPPRARPSGLGMMLADIAAADDAGGIPIVDRLLSWARSKSAEQPRLIALLGDFGMGKTVTCQLVARALLEESNRTVDAPVPIYLDLRDIRRPENPDDITLEGLIGDMLRAPGSTGPSARDVIAFAREHGALIIFDGLDEVTNKLPLDTAKRVYRELLSIVPTEAWSEDARRRGGVEDRFAGPSILISCRSQYFADFSAERGFLSDSDRSGLDLRADIAAYVMLPFDADQVRLYLKRNLGTADSARALALLEETYDLKELAARPILLKYIGEMVDRLEQEKAKGVQINITRLYDILVEQAFQRDEPKHVIPIGDKKKLLQSLALYLHRRGEDEISTFALTEWLDAEIAARHPRIRDAISTSLGLRLVDVLAQDFRNATLLSRPSEGGFRFGHTSIREYFLADALYRSVASPDTDAWMMPSPSRETVEFLLKRYQIESRVDRKIFDAAFIRRLVPGQAAEVRALAFTLWLASIATPLPLPRPGVIDCTGIDQSGKLLSGTPSKLLPLKNSIWCGAMLRRTEFRHVDLTGAKFDDADGRGAIFFASLLKGASFGQARLDGSRWRGCNIDPQVLDQALLTDSEAVNCTYGGKAWRPQAPIPADASHWHPVETCQMGQATSLAFTVLDGRPILITAADDGRIRLIDTDYGHLVHIIEGNLGVAQSGQVAQYDGRTCLFVANRHGLIQVWDLHNRNLVTSLRTDSGFLRSMSIGEINGECAIAFITADSVQCWAIATSQRIFRHEDLKDPLVNAMACVIDRGELLFTDILDDSLCIRHAFSGKTDVIVHDFGDGRAYHIIRHYDHLLAAIGSENEAPVILDLETSQVIANLVETTPAIHSMEFTKVNGELFLCATSDRGVVDVWDGLTGELLDSSVHRDWPGGVTMGLSSGQISVIISVKGDLRMRSLGSASRLSILHDAGLEIDELALGFIDKLPIVTFSTIFGLGVINGLTGELETAAAASLQRGYSFAYKKIGEKAYLVTGHPTNGVMISDGVDGSPMGSISADVSYYTRLLISTLDDDPITIVVGRDKIAAYRIHDGEKVADLERHLDFSLRQFSAVETDAGSFFAASSPNAVTVINIGTGALVVEHEMHRNIHSVHLANLDGQAILYVGDQAGWVQAIDVARGECLWSTLIHVDYVRAIDHFEKDGQLFLVTGGDDGQVKIVDARNGIIVGAGTRHNHWVQTVTAEMHDGDLVIASGGSDSIVRVSTFRDITAMPDRIVAHVLDARAHLVLEKTVDGYALETHGVDAWRRWTASYQVGTELYLTGIEDMPRS